MKLRNKLLILLLLFSSFMVINDTFAMPENIDDSSNIVLLENDETIKFNSIMVNEYKADFVDGNYYVNVPSNVEVVTITGDIPAGYSASGLDEQTLSYGLNKIELYLLSPEGITLNYGLYITRLESEEVTSTELTKLSVEGYNINFKSNIKEYTIKVKKDVNKLNITGEAENDQVKINGLGEVSLTEGKNILKITVTYGELNATSYTINVEREDNSLMIVGIITVSLIGLSVIVYFIGKAVLSKKEKKVEEVKEEIEKQKEITPSNELEVNGENIKVVEPTVIGKEEIPDEYIDSPFNYVANAGEITNESTFVKPIELEPTVEEPAPVVEEEKVEIVNEPAPIVEEQEVAPVEVEQELPVVEEQEDIERGNKKSLIRLKELLLEKENEQYPAITLDELTKEILSSNFVDLDKNKEDNNQIKYEEPKQEDTLDSVIGVIKEK